MLYDPGLGRLDEVVRSGCEAWVECGGVVRRMLLQVQE
jgi:hypothetical protein